MVFSSPIFLFWFLPAAYLGGRFLPGIPLKNAWLALASLVFYTFGQPRYAVLLLLSVLINYLAGLWIMAGGGRLAVGCAAAADMLLLGTFKYLDFLLRTAGTLLGLSIPLTGIVLPIGISFYTFQGLSYVIDVYRDPDTGTKNLGKLILYISFFPQLIAGPIVKYHDVASQIDRREMTPELTLTGLERFIGGLGKKLLLANTVGKAADAVFAMTAGELDLRLAWLGAVCYTLQIYFDFSGYSDMAIGLGRILGFSFLENFDQPYRSRSIREFWRRWHISLSSWFRDYLYIPLGGNRRGRGRTALNHLLVFLATGLWHGANWTFVVWGLWHGLFSTLEGADIIPRRLRESPLGHVYTMLVVILGFVMFRADTLGAGLMMLSRMFTGFAFTPAHGLALRALLDRRTVCVLAAAVLFAAGLPQKLAEKLPRAPAPCQAVRFLAWAGVLALCVLDLSNATFNPFIYFQF